ncbi:hypothetical protein EUTSA_v10004096mg [Eutrema salsugineum]|uniref:SAP domain-containing protein n=1 Tax=Eutrema salsugineum TaxID=72664 RepID=V4KMJ9_EUTSA|nr:hypothetical protein EUTSA_v10004096mg [Eutrema salsugineum]
MSKEKVIIDLCSSDEEEEEDGFGDENNCEEEFDETEEEEDTTSSEDWSHDDAAESDVEEDDGTTEENDDDDDKITRLLTAGGDLKALNVKECKAYLRKHGLRLSGTKAVFIERIVEHWRIKDGSGKVLYPISSFAINCKGDVCKGDTVLFTQKVHQKYEKVKGSGKIMGRRTVAGQVVKESYGTAKQQHTFTIEVLWCEGIQKLPPLYPLLVKGRNLYRLMTLRQRWADEEDRVKVLSEKHSRGAAARRVMRERKIKSGYVLIDGRLQKPGRVKKPCAVKTRKNEKDENQTQRFRQDIPANHSLVAFPNQNPSQVRKNPTQSRNKNPTFDSYNSHYTYAPRPYAPFNVPHSHLPRPNIPPSRSYAYSTQQNQSIQRPPPAFYITHQRRPNDNNHTHHTSSNSGYNYGVRDLDHFSDMMISRRREGDRYRQSEDARRPFKNHHTTDYSDSNNGYNHGARDLDMRSHGRKGNTHRQSRDTLGEVFN